MSVTVAFVAAADVTVDVIAAVLAIVDVVEIEESRGSRKGGFKCLSRKEGTNCGLFDEDIERG